MRNDVAKVGGNNCYPPRAMRAEQAAAYLGMSKSIFLKLVSEGQMPVAVHILGMVSWDRLELDAGYDAFKETPLKNTLHAGLG